MTQTRTAQKKRVQSLPPIVSQKSKVLILGSMPGVESLEAEEYYKRPRNEFWPIMGKLFGAGLSLPYPKRVALLKAAGVALWDTIWECEREGSQDASIKEEVVNDFPVFFDKYPNITHVFFNGREAEKAFRRHVLPTLTEDQHRPLHCLPSTSPLYAAMTPNAKAQAWRVVIEALALPPAKPKPKEPIQ
jgi:TDG/mug DNA glycosylase family protein